MSNSSTHSEHILSLKSADEHTQSGTCTCKKVKFTATSHIYISAYCHCRICCHIHGVAALHLVVMKNVQITEGEELTKVFQNPWPLDHKLYPGQTADRLTYTACTDCSTVVYHLTKVTGPDGEEHKFYTLFPCLFNMETKDDSVSCGVSSKLPPHLQPKAHFNYENRQYDWPDDLPKMLTDSKSSTFTCSNNDGSIKEPPTTLTLDLAQQVIAKLLNIATSRGTKPMSVAIVDTRNALVAFATQDGSRILGPEIATAKAKGALALECSSRKIGEMAQVRPHFMQALNVLNKGELVPGPGGVLIRSQGNALLGAIGVSGDAPDVDEAVAVEALSAHSLVGEV